jgi:hypothetical protein
MYSVSQSSPLKDHISSIPDFQLLSINIQSIWLWVLPSGEVQVYLWMFRCGNIMPLTTRFFNVAKFTTLTPVSLLSWCTLIPNCWFENTLSPQFYIKKS